VALTDWAREKSTRLSNRQWELPPTTAMSLRPKRRSSAAAASAKSDDEQAALSATQGPSKPKA